MIQCVHDNEDKVTRSHKNDEFLVIKEMSSYNMIYNMILGPIRLHTIKAITSIYYLKPKLTTMNRTREEKKDQLIMTGTCYIVA